MGTVEICCLFAVAGAAGWLIFPARWLARRVRAAAMRRRQERFEREIESLNIDFHAVAESFRRVWLWLNWVEHWQYIAPHDPMGLFWWDIQEG